MTVPVATETMGQTDPYDQGLEDLSEAVTVPERLRVLDRVCDVVVQRSPFMSCIPDCSECCQQQVLAGLAEWRVLLDWIQAQLSLDQQRSLVTRAENLLCDDSTSLPIWMKLKPLDDTGTDYLETINTALENKRTPCPFLVDGRCSVYDARPAICRGYGRMMRTQEGAFYCDNILDKMERAVTDLESITLPVFQAYHRAVLDSDGGLDEVNLLPVWILAHRAPNGALVPDAHGIDPQSPFPVVDGYWSYDGES